MLYFSNMNKNVAIYVDGLNFYHGTKELPFENSANVNLSSLSKTFLKKDQKLVKIHYFSTYASWDKKKSSLHANYVKRLKESGVEVTMSHFKKRKIRCEKCKNEWTTHEEKETDVRLALQILLDALEDIYDVAFVLSGDSDLVPALELVKELRPNKRILIALPKHRFKYARDMRNVTHGILNISTAKIRKHLF